MIEIENISKSFGPVKAVCDANLTIHPNSLFGIIGPDGAGKTTLFRMIASLMLPDKGNIRVFGMNTRKDYSAIRSFIGYMPGRFSLYPDLSVDENLNFYATIFNTTVEENYANIEPIYRLLEPFKNRLSGKLSGGMKQKLALCCALIHNPKLLILDEPTTGVDAVSRKEFWDTLNMLKSGGMTILVSTPYMDEATRCDKVAMMMDGKVMVENTPQAILSDFKPRLYELSVSDRLKALTVLRKMNGIKQAYLFGHTVHVALETEEINEQWLHGELVKNGIGEYSLAPATPEFEDCFIETVENLKRRWQ